jgi:hypothetical protein
MEERFLKPTKESSEGTAGLANCHDCVLRSERAKRRRSPFGIVPSENAEVEELRDWKVDCGDIRGDPGIAREISEFIEKHRVLSVTMTDGVFGCSHQEGERNGAQFASFGPDDALRGGGTVVSLRPMLRTQTRRRRPGTPDAPTLAESASPTLAQGS